jgi:hypothetical protein
MSGAGISLVYVLAADQKRGREKERERVICVRERVGTVV